MMKKLQLNAFVFVALFLFTSTGYAQPVTQKKSEATTLPEDNLILYANFTYHNQNTPGELYGQDMDLSDIGANTSALHTHINYEVADNFSDVNGSVTQIEVFGLYAIIDSEGWGNADPGEQLFFNIRFYPYNVNQPQWGSPTNEYLDIPTTSIDAQEPWSIGFNVWKFTLNIPATYITNGWISVQSVDGDGWFLWHKSVDNDLHSWQKNHNNKSNKLARISTEGQSKVGPVEYDFAFNLYGIAGEPDDMHWVTFNVNMAQTPEFNPEQHNVYLTGSFTGWSEPGHEGSIEMTHSQGTIFSTTMELQSGEYIYKYFSDAYGDGWAGGEWEGDPNRTIFVSQNMTINDTWGLYSEEYFELLLQASPEGSGTLAGSGYYQAGEIAYLQALPSTGFMFLNWTDEYGTMLSSNPDFQYIMQAKDHTLTANFLDGEPGQYLLTLQIVPHEGGQVSGDGAYNQGDQVIVSATPNQGYVFHNWRKNGSVIGTQTQLVYTMPAENATLTAHFYSEDNPPYTLTLQRQPQVGGTVTGAGEYLEGEEIVLSAIPAEGYGFIRWLEMGSGSIYTDPTFNYSMPAQDITLIAYFDLVDFVQQHKSHNLKLFPNPAQSNVTIS
ncbi:MAG: hypothetical protein EA361_05925, partial [Bacteroidetes bacterium]